MAKGFSFLIIPNRDIKTHEGFLLRQGIAYGWLGAGSETEMVSVDGYTRHKSTVNINRSNLSYRNLTRDEAKKEGIKIPTKRR